MRATDPNRQFAPDLLGLVMLVGLAVWLLLAWRGLHEHPRPVWPTSRLIRS